VLSEALPIAKKAGVVTAIAVAKEGREAVRQWKEARAGEPKGSEASWTTIKVRVPPDVNDSYEEAMLLAKNIGITQGASFSSDDNRWEQFQALVIAALETLRAEHETHHAATGR
jgi:hypothetical protein